MIDAPHYLAAQEVLQYLSTLTDERDQRIFNSAGFGIMLPSDIPQEGTTPALRVWVSNPSYEVTTEQLYTGERRFTISIGVYDWIPMDIIASGSDGVVANDGVTFTSQTANFFGYDGCKIWLNDTSMAYMTIVNPNTVTLSNAVTPGSNISWWFQLGPQEPARRLINYSDYILRALTLMDVSGTGFKWDGHFWAPDDRQNIRPDLFSQLRRYNGDIPLKAPWYAVEIPLGALAWDRGVEG